MDISQAIAELKKEPGFTENVGMILVHNGVVRGWSRKDHAGVTAIEITPDHDRIKALCAEIEQRPGIFRACVRKTADFQGNYRKSCSGLAGASSLDGGV